MTTSLIPPTAALAATVLTLGACGGSSGSSGGDPMDGPEMTGPGAILQRADTLLFIGERARWSLTTGDITIADTIVETADCSGARCTWADGTETTVRDLAGAFDGVGSGGSDATLGMRGGFGTATARSGFEVTESVPGVTVTAAPEATSYGFWGEHGFAAVTLASGALSGQVDGEPIGGDFALATAWAAGDAAGTSPAGSGGATWRGVAEAVETGAFERLAGTATVRVADLSRPRVGVEIDVPGHVIGAPGWADMPLSAGSFSSGTPGGGDHLAGSFNGPGHVEAWGVFDTSAYIGAFGARREP